MVFYDDKGFPLIVRPLGQTLQLPKRLRNFIKCLFILPQIIRAFSTR